MRPLRTALAAGIILATASVAAHASAAAPGVKVTQGILRGTTQGAAHAFLGIPYAAPPTGSRRWQAPAAAPAWNGVRDASKFGSNCFQDEPRLFGPYTAEFLVDARGSEDCLFLNVWTRDVAPQARMPVLFYIHGGGFGSGSGSIPIYNGAALAARGVVVVTLNYRLGALGFLAHPELSAESSERISGNYGLQDVIAALRWVAANIERLGGDPARVTIAGQSAGAALVNELMISPAARGLFARAISQSGAGMGIVVPTLSDAEALGRASLAAAGIASIKAARELPVERVWEIRPPQPAEKTPGAPPLGFLPVIDGRYLGADPENPANPVISPVPLLTGYTLDDIGAALAGPTTPAQFGEAVRARYGNQAERFLALYPHGNDVEATASAKIMARDRFMASLLLWSQARSKASGQTIFAYCFEHAPPSPDQVAWGTFHTAEVPYIFSTLSAGKRKYGEDDRKVAAQLGTLWINFVSTGMPASSDVPAWSAVAAGDDEVMQIGDQPGLRPAVSGAERMAAFQAYYESGNLLSIF